MSSVSWTDKQVDQLKSAGVPIAPSNVIGRIFQFSSIEGENLVVTGTVTGLVVSDTNGVQLSVSVPELLGQPINCLSFREGTWKLELTADGLCFDRSTLVGQLMLW